ncbi:beta-phosphoglucomutase [Salirhabdus salicampi]|uniref:beta-phosphoglucomutase n=1 Tax=Salirhabdus salicampi TaxID=476102 RepID=UPI0020C2E19D|nr:beta-phosphoglucomutase [Salirhabdus salicampi]MCP8617867.1 beta-phosphoglucomutase [Salirhabdus salicampi]
MDSRVKAVIFDLDGVITDTAEFHYVAWGNLASSLGISFDREFNENLKGISRMESLEKILKYGQKANEFTLEQKQELAYKKNEYYKQLIKQVTPAHILPGIKELIEELKRNNLKLAVASASKNATTILTSLGLLDYFDYIVDVEKIKNGKPDPEIFLNAAKHLDVPKENCIGVEDAAAGVEAIKAASMFAVGVGQREILSRADLVVNSTVELTYSKLIKAFIECQNSLTS